MINRQRPRIAQADLIANARGVAFAAFASIDAIAGILGCSAAEAAAFQEEARCDFQSLQFAVAQVRTGVAS